MKKNCVPHFLLIVLSCTSISRVAALDGTPTTEASEKICQQLTDKCYEDSKKSNNLSEDEIVRIVKEKLNSTLSTKDNDRFCKFTNDIQLCYDEISEKCANYEDLAKKSTAVNAQAKLFNCAALTSCAFKALTCESKILTSSKLDRDRWNLVKSEETRRKYLIVRMERDKACDFALPVIKCFNDFAEKCKNDPTYKEILRASVDVLKVYLCPSPDDGKFKKCEGLLKTCKDESMDVTLQQQVEQIVWSPAETDNSGIIKQFGKDKGCKFAKTFRRCHTKVEDQYLQCERVDLYFRPILNVTELTETHFKCEQDCEDIRNQCKESGMSESGVSSYEIEEVFEATDTELREKLDQFQDLFQTMGKRGCRFMEVFRDCHAENKKQCGDNDPNFRPILELTKTVYDRLHCGCASAVASLFLILASILLIFYQRVW